MMSSNRNRVPGAPNLDPADPNALIPLQPAPALVPAPAPVLNADEADVQPQMSTKDIFKQLAKATGKATGAILYNAAVLAYKTATFGPDGTLWINITGEADGKSKFDGSFINPQSNPNANPYSNPYTSRHASAVAPKNTSSTPGPGRPQG